MYKKSVMHVQTCCFTNLNQLLFFFAVLVAVAVVVACELPIVETMKLK